MPSVQTNYTIWWICPLNFIHRNKTFSLFPYKYFLGSILAPLLFNLYIGDMPATDSRKFGYADDSALATKAKSFQECEETLNKELPVLERYFKKWGLKPNPKKTESITFHLNNREANYQLEISFCGQPVKHNSHPKYLLALQRTRHLQTESNVRIRQPKSRLETTSFTSFVEPHADADT